MFLSNATFEQIHADVIGISNLEVSRKYVKGNKSFKIFSQYFKLKVGATACLNP